ncbi:unnamed protein product [Oncorhynchus mykiss]|uniref:Uncharacterized protein n=1 Tax=Oncorhynchus mykiss TaxID=8022 RepID=A0A060YUH3_ONCMY|nr:unnamed protein product [Oncorhynchus mykiss]
MSPDSAVLGSGHSNLSSNFSEWYALHSKSRLLYGPFSLNTLKPLKLYRRPSTYVLLRPVTRFDWKTEHTPLSYVTTALPSTRTDMAAYMITSTLRRVLLVAKHASFQSRCCVASSRVQYSTVYDSNEKVTYDSQGAGLSQGCMEG